MSIVHHSSHAALVRHLAGGNEPTLTFAERVTAYAAEHHLSVAEATKKLATPFAKDARDHERGDNLPIARTMVTTAVPTPRGDSRILAEAERRVLASNGRLDLRDAIRAVTLTDAGAVADYCEAFNCGRR